jgi:hypothetical protein
MRPAVVALLTVSLAIAVGPQPPSPLRAAATGTEPLSAEQERDVRRSVPPGAVIRGRVIAGDSGIPVADSAVALVPLGRGTAAGAAGAIDTARAQRGITVDGAGRFEVMGVGAGYYRLLASPGATQAQYLTGRFPDPRWDHPAVLAISGEEVVAGIEIRLPRAAVITGRVVDEGGGPLAAIAVSVQPVLPGNRRGALRNPANLPTLTGVMGCAVGT